MRGLTSLACRSLAARRLRTVLTVLGIALGVGVLFASLTTDAGIDAAVDRATRDLVGRADLRITAFQETGLSRETVEAIRTTPGVDIAVPALERRIYLRRAPGLAGPLPPPVTVLGIDPVLDGRVHDLAVVAGSPLVRRDQAGALISERLAERDGLGLGSELTLDGAGTTERFRVVGVLAGDGPLVGALGRVVVLPIEAAGRVFGVDGVDRVDLRVAEPFTAADVESALEARLLQEPYVLSSPDDVAASLRASTADLRAITALIAAVSLFVGAFLIFNTLSMTVTERTREVGLLRAAGATRRQVTAFILAGAVVLGVLGAAAGLVVGLLLTLLMAAHVATIGALPLDRPEVPLPAFLVAAAVGLIVTLAAALEPAWRAGTIAPVEALRLRADQGSAQRARLRWLVAVFAAIGLTSFAASADGGATGGGARALAVYAILLGATLASPFLIGPLGRLAGTPFALVSRLEERLARGSLVRDRSRTALTVGALTVGLAMIVALGAVAHNARRGAADWLADVVPGDLVLTSIRPVLPDEPVLGDLRAVAGVERVTPIGTFDIAWDGKRLDASAVVGADLLADGRPRFVAGDPLAALTALDAGTGVVLPRAQAGLLRLAVGDRMAAVGSAGRSVDLEVVGIVDRSLPGTSSESVLVGWRVATDQLGVAGADFLAVRFAPGAAPRAASLVEAVARKAALEPATIDRVQGAVSDALSRVFGLFDALALVAVLVAALGIVNTLTMNVVERVREIGMLRATGMTRRQVGRMVVVEAGILGLIGVILGAGTGLVVGVVMTVLAGGRIDLALDLPWAALASCLLLGVAVSMAAAWYPARLAGRLSIVRAVQFE